MASRSSRRRKRADRRAAARRAEVRPTRQRRPRPSDRVETSHDEEFEDQEVWGEQDWDKVDWEDGEWEWVEDEESDWDEEEGDWDEEAREAETEEEEGPRWGLGDVFGGWVIAQALVIMTMFAVVSYLGYPRVAEVGSAVGQALGHIAIDEPVRVLNVLGELDMEWQMVLQIPLWVGLAGAAVYAAKRKGTSLREDFGFWAQPADALKGLPLGIACQLLLVPAVYLPLELLADSPDASEPARDLVDTAVTPVGVILLLLAVGLLAPVAEELFYRGLAQRALLRRLGRPIWAVVVASLLFAFAHLQTVQFPALVAVGIVFGIVAMRTGRLGMSVFAHIGFNLTTATFFLAGWTLPFT